MTAPQKTLRWAFIGLVIAFAFWRFAENSADPDLWGHVLYGQRALSIGLEHEEPFSWTAQGHRWINHENMAELAMGFVHQIGGATGLWLLMVGLSMLAFLGAIRIGIKRAGSECALVVWFIALLVAREIAIGFAMRPQLFSAVFFVNFLMQMVALHRGSKIPRFTLPLLICVWINTHGAVLLAVVLLFGATGLSLIQLFLEKRGWEKRLPIKLEPLPRSTIPTLLIALALGIGAMFINPYGADLPLWLMKSVAYTRPEIDEWNPTALHPQHILFFVIAAALIIALLVNRRPAMLWEYGVLGVLMIAALRHERHIPLFGLAVIVLGSRYLADLLARLAPRAQNIAALLKRPGPAWVSAALLTTMALACIGVTISHEKQRFWQMEIPHADYPVNAFKFIQEHNLDGNLIVYFNWAQQAIWELPESRVSFDGRLDTAYPRELIEDHWRFYWDTKPDFQILQPEKADVAILPVDAQGALRLYQDPQWQLVYTDPVAAIFVQNKELLKNLSGMPLPHDAGEDATLGRSPFPTESSGWANIVP